MLIWGDARTYKYNSMAAAATVMTMTMTKTKNDNDQGTGNAYFGCFLAQTMAYLQPFMLLVHPEYTVPGTRYFG